MKRFTSAAAAAFVLVTRFVTAQAPTEMALTHLLGDEETGTSRLLVSPGEVRVKGESRAKDGAPGTEIVAILQRFETGVLKRYDRELKSAKDGLVISAVSASVDGDTVSFRESGPIGSRTRTLTAPPLDFVVDAACPELFIPFLADLGRKSVRVLILPELEIKTVVLEERESGRFAAIPGGGVTVLTGAGGAFKKLVLPGPGEHVVVPSGSPESRPAPPRGRETPVVLNLEGGVRLALTLTLPAEGDGPYPGVLLLGDAGPRDRNGVGSGSLVPILKLLSDELAAAGIASVRADKRGSGQSAGPDPDLAALTADAKSLLEVVAMHPAIDRARVFIAGHGEGAVIAAALASDLARAPRDKAIRLAGVIAIAGPARPLAEALEARLRVRLMAAGQMQESIDGTVAAFRVEIDNLRQLPESAPTKPGQALLRDLVKIDPAVQLAAVKVPLLVLHAADDREVPASQVALLRASLAFSGQGRARFEIVEGADHDLLTTAKSAAMTGSEPQPADVARSLHPQFPALIREFIERGATSRNSGR